MTRQEKTWIAILVGSVFVTRLIQYLNTYVVAVDAVRYLTGCELIFEGRITEGLKIADKPPLYFLLCTYLNFFVGNIEVSGHLVSIISASLTVIPLYLLTRDILNQKSALVACFIFVILPHFAETQTDALTDSTYIFLFLSSITLTWFSLKKFNMTLHILAATSSALTYLTRSEGVYTLAIFVVTTIVGIFVRKELRSKQVVGSLLLGVLIFSMIAYPYLLWMRKETGNWTISMATGFKKLGEQITSIDDTQRGTTNIVAKLWKAVEELALRVVQLNYFIFVIPLLAGITVMILSKEFKTGMLYLLLISFFYILAPVRASLSGYSITERYIILPVMLLLPLVAYGILKVLSFINTKLKLKESHSKALVIVLMVAVSLPLLYRIVRERRRERIPLKEAGYWIKENIKKETEIYTIIGREESRISYYSKRQFKGLAMSPEGIELAAAVKNAVIIVEAESLKKFSEKNTDTFNKNFILFKEFPLVKKEAKDKVVHIYQPRQSN